MAAHDREDRHGGSAACDGVDDVEQRTECDPQGSTAGHDGAGSRCRVSAWGRTRA